MAPVRWQTVCEMVFSTTSEWCGVVFATITLILETVVAGVVC